MDDKKLIAAVAKKAGWTHIHTHDLPGNNIQIKGRPPGSKMTYIELPPWLTSVDECLKLLDKEKQFEITWLSGQQRWRVYYEGLMPMAYHKLLPRAILFAWLEA